MHTMNIQEKDEDPGSAGKQSSSHLLSPSSRRLHESLRTCGPGLVCGWGGSLSWHCTAPAPLLRLRLMWLWPAFARALACPHLAAVGPRCHDLLLEPFQRRQDGHLGGLGGAGLRGAPLARPVLGRADGFGRGEHGGTSAPRCGGFGGTGRGTGGGVLRLLLCFGRGLFGGGGVCRGLGDFWLGGTSDGVHLSLLRPLRRHETPGIYRMTEGRERKKGWRGLGKTIGTG